MARDQRRCAQQTHTHNTHTHTRTVARDLRRRARDNAMFGYIPPVSLACDSERGWVGEGGWVINETVGCIGESAQPASNRDEYASTQIPISPSVFHSDTREYPRTRDTTGMHLSGKRTHTTDVHTQTHTKSFQALQKATVLLLSPREPVRLELVLAFSLASSRRIIAARYQVLPGSAFAGGPIEYQIDTCTHAHRM
jgi:hypothetical protein